MTLFAEGRNSPRLSWWGEMVTVGFSAWAACGAFLDGWAHSKVVQFETFFTPWHAVFYSGFVALTVWLGWSVRRFARAGRRGLEAIPAGYRLGVLGLGIFTLGTVGDMLWHMGLGIEQEGERLSSPAHLALFVGGLLAITSPLRAAWADPERTPTLRRFLPPLLSATLATMVMVFMIGHLWAFYSADLIGRLQYGTALDQLASTAEAKRAFGYLIQARVGGSLLLSTALLLAPLLVLVRRWRLPPGSATIMFATVALGMSALRELHLAETVFVALLTGATADWLLATLRPSSSRVGAFRLFAALVPLILWTLYFAATALRWGLGVSPELWVGGIFFAAATGLGLALVMLPGGEPTEFQAGQGDLR
ncbi:MAG TPA: hypothetical protein VNN19_07205 [bacterium]|nr:hypothetical protein [bacterium]